MKKEAEKEPESEQIETVLVNGKRIRTWDYMLPVSGDIVKLREVGIYTSRKMEQEAGVTDKESLDKDTPILGILYDKRDKLIKLFVPEFVIEPKDFNMKNYTEDDLLDIIIAVFNRGTKQVGIGGVMAGRKFRHVVDGGGVESSVEADEPAPK